MLTREEGRETYIHTCVGTSLENRIEVNLHDLYAYILIDGKMHHIRYCPHCGIKVDEDIRMN